MDIADVWRTLRRYPADTPLEPTWKRQGRESQRPSRRSA